MWRYSNGNYCALGLLVQHVTGSQLDAAARVAVFDPILVTGPHLTTDGVQPGDAPYFKNVARFDRLGGAGTWMASTDDIAAILSAGIAERPRHPRLARRHGRSVRLGPHRDGRRCQGVLLGFWTAGARSWSA